MFQLPLLSHKINTGIFFQCMDDGIIWRTPHVYLYKNIHRSSEFPKRFKQKLETQIKINIRKLDMETED